MKATGLTLLLALASGAVVEAGTAVRFTDVTAASGVTLTTTCGRTPSREILEVNGGGVALLDYDDDGDLDLFVANGATLDDPEHGPGSRLYANDGRGRFRDVTSEVGLRLTRWAMGVAVGDYDADGDDDLYVTCFGPNVLLRNDLSDGKRRWVDATTAAGVGDPRWGTSAAFIDVEGDGDLDLYVANYLEFDPQRPPARRRFKGVEVFGGPMGLVAPHDVLYVNSGDGTFRDATRQSGCRPARPGYGLGVVAVDFDRDGRQDLFVGNDSTDNFLFRNRGGGRFEEIGVVAGVATNLDGRPQATMGIAVGDVDGNGLPDLFTTNFSSDTNTLHANLGRNLFEDRTSRFGLAAVSRPYLSWGAGLYDLDSDGDEDLVVASGHIYPQAANREMDTGYRQPLLLFERESARFGRVKDRGDVFQQLYDGRSIAFGDLDGDGDVDMVMTQLNGPVKVLRNDSPHAGVVVVELAGGVGNPRGLGAEVELVAGARAQRRWIHGGSYQSVDAPAAYFGLGPQAPDHVELRVRWPTGKSTKHVAVPTGRRVRVELESSAIRSEPLARAD